MSRPVLARLTEPAPLLTLEEAKQHLRVEFDDDDPLIAVLVQSVTYALDGPEGMYGYPVTSQQWSLSTHGPDQDGLLRLPITPAAGLVSLSYFPRGGGAAVVANSPAALTAWTLRASDTWAYVAPSSGTWPALDDRPDAVTVVYTAGYAEPFADIKHAARLMLGHFYANREAVVTGAISTAIQMSVDTLVNLRRRWWLS